ncbi:hypothetical protein [Deinococcus aquatilis]|uniref:hypothetical protein n=1 Tax=Deinococcus aquatilis TaxID=519440 RepID=UPI000366DAA5|nr:hypothetical protein [Deinococcus aquatilis]
MSQLEQLLSLMDESLQAQAAVWRNPDLCPSAEVLEKLLESYRRRVPWRSLLVIYTLRREPPYWERCFRCLVTIHNYWFAPWLEQGCPEDLTSFRFPELTGKERRRAVRAVGHALEDSLRTGLADDANTQYAVRILLTGEYLPSQHWWNFQSLPEPILKLLQQHLQQHCQSPLKIPARYDAVLRQLHSYLTEPWGRTMACAAAVLIGDLTVRDNFHQPDSLQSYLSGLAHIYRTLGIKKDGPLTEHQLRQYVGRRKLNLKYLGYYAGAVHAQNRFLGMQRSVISFQPWLLGSVDVTKLLPNTSHPTLSPRAPDAKAILRVVGRLYQAAEDRTELLRQVAEAVDKAKSGLQANGQSSIDFHLSVTVSGAPSLLHLRVHCAMTLAKQTYGSQAQFQGYHGHYLTEYLGTTQPDTGASVPDPFFIPIVRSWYDCQARRRLEKLGYARKDLTHSQAGLLQPSDSLGNLCKTLAHRARTEGIAAPTLFEAQLLYNAAAYSLLILMLLQWSGLRTNELLQISANPSQNPDDSVEFWVRHKGKKDERYRSTEHVITEKIVPYWRTVMDIRKKEWPRAPQIVPQYGEKYNSRKGYYLLQTIEGLREDTVNALIRFLLQDLAPSSVPDTLLRG